MVRIKMIFIIFPFVIKCIKSFNSNYSFLKKKCFINSPNAITRSVGIIIMLIPFRYPKITLLFTRLFPITNQANATTRVTGIIKMTKKASLQDLSMIVTSFSQVTDFYFTIEVTYFLIVIIIGFEQDYEYD